MDTAGFWKVHIEDMMGKKCKSTCLSDCRSLVDCVKTDVVKLHQEKSLVVVTHSLRQAKGAEHSLAYIPTSLQLADAMTKKVECKLLRRFINDGVFVTAGLGRRTFKLADAVGALDSHQGD